MTAREHPMARRRVTLVLDFGELPEAAFTGRLRALLKLALRSFGARCASVAELPPAAPPTGGAGTIMGAAPAPPTRKARRERASEGRGSIRPIDATDGSRGGGRSPIGSDVPASTSARHFRRALLSEAAGLEADGWIVALAHHLPSVPGDAAALLELGAADAPQAASEALEAARSDGGGR